MDFKFKGISADSLNIKVINIKRSLMPTVKDIYESIPGKHGSVLFSQPFGDRLIQFDCAIPNYTPKNIKEIADFLYSNNYEKLEIYDEEDCFYMAKLLNEGDIAEKVLTGYFTLEFVAQPFKYSHKIYAYEWNTAENKRINILNNGSFNTPIKLRIKTMTSTLAGIDLPALALGTAGIKGEIMGVKVMINDDIVKYNGIISEDDEVIIDTKDFIVTKNGLNDIKNWDGDFPLLKPGENILEYASDNEEDAQIEVIYRERWI